ncbi:acetyl-CoA carboxylase biotin carboxyl carrier protein [Tunicatimonas pelagia]|uniref:acetyl-CoA carboxylase biotin carboxyl carrier protein n=1 Tax=Tunicatimonas pelagia TaxID=931531 RepID=UPI0026671663|nr:acetyl-CoA carboxylase biotin carboxyl carrier protein [Tunicatimonas pelagia]WKN46293.1 acetyl-CoA carboxylase biotin carboxyl carrier protein [Tunicatimonas pelagia]
MKISEIRNLLDFIAKAGLDEVELETDDIKLKIKKNSSPEVHQSIIHSPGVPSMPSDATGLVAIPSQPTSPSATTPSSTSPSEEEIKESTGSEDKSNYVAIKSPMIGTFYKSPNPESGPFVQVGDRISKGQAVCIIEAMKLFNEIEAEQAGTIVEVLVEDSSPVEFDQPLFLIDPA